MSKETAAKRKDEKAPNIRIANAGRRLRKMTHISDEKRKTLKNRMDVFA